MALTLKVTAGPSTLEETIEKGVQGQRGTWCRLASAVRAAQTHSPDALAGAPGGSVRDTGPLPASQKVP